MKIYAYYLLEMDMQPLYAFAKEKEIAKRFEESRNMNKFLKKELSLNKDDYYQFCDTFKSHQLTVATFTTKDPSRPTTKREIKVVCTWDEEKTSIIKQDEAYQLFFSKNLLPPKIFTGEVQDTLCALGYHSIYTWLHDQYFLPFFDMAENDLIYDIDPDEKSVDPARYEIETFGIFMYLYGNTMK